MGEPPIQLHKSALFNTDSYNPIFHFLFLLS